MSLEEAVRYIRDVLNTWGSWKEHHRPLVQALEVILRHIDNGGNIREP